MQAKDSVFFTSSVPHPLLLVIRPGRGGAVAAVPSGHWRRPQGAAGKVSTLAAWGAGVEAGPSALLLPVPPPPRAPASPCPPGGEDVREQMAAFLAQRSAS